MKYTANDIARILAASETIDSIPEPSIEDVYGKTKELIGLLSEILPTDVPACQYKNIEITSSLTMSIRLYGGNQEDGHTFGFVFCSPAHSCLSRSSKIAWDGSEHEHTDCSSRENMLPKWYALLKNKESVIEQAIAIRQRVNAEKVARVQCLK